MRSSTLAGTGGSSLSASLGVGWQRGLHPPAGDHTSVLLNNVVIVDPLRHHAAMSLIASAHRIKALTCALLD